MRISFNKQFLDGTGRPLSAGRVTLYVHDSDVALDVYTLSGTVYSRAENPVILDDEGRMDTLWFDAAIVDVRVEKNVDGVYDQVDTFQYGFQVPDVTNDTLVYGMDGLASANPELGTVTVIGYRNGHDCGPRSFVWDSTCTAAEDGGAIVASSASDMGRWILVSDSPYMPSSWYGIVPGQDEANIVSLLTYPETVGQWSIKLPPYPRFLKGTYKTQGTLTSNKIIAFDPEARFTKATLSCRAAVIVNNSNYVADFVFNGEGVKAHSSWFRTVDAFWHCGADIYEIDDTNWFTDSTLYTSVDLLNRKISGSKRIEMTYATGAYLQIRNCNICGQRIFSPRYDVLRFKDTEFNQSWFAKVNIDYWDFGSLSQDHKIQLLTSDGNIIDYAKFWQPDVYLKACLGNGDTTFDGHDLPYSTTNNDQFTTIRNCRFNSGSHFTDSKCGSWENVTIGSGLEFTGHDRIVLMTNCKFGLSSYTDSSSVTSMNISNCEVVNGGTWNVSDTALAVYDSRWAPGLTISEAAKTARTRNKAVSFTRTVFTDANSTMWLNDITLQSCTCCEHIYLVPFYDDSKFKHNCVLRDNRFTSNFRLDIAPKDMANEADVYNTYCSLVIENNNFEQTDSKGIWMPYCTNAFDWTKLYLGSSIGSSFTGNRGNCPGEKPYHLFMSSNMTESYNVSSGNDVHYLPVATYGHRMWNTSTDKMFWLNVFGWQCEPSDQSWNMYTGRSAEMHHCAMVHATRVAMSDENNDQFLVVHAWSDNDDFDDDMLVVYP